MSKCRAPIDFERTVTTRGARVPVRPIPLAYDTGSFVAPECAKGSTENAW